MTSDQPLLIGILASLLVHLVHVPVGEGTKKMQLEDATRVLCTSLYNYTHFFVTCDQPLLSDWY